jgi:hypothetical protein
MYIKGMHKAEGGVAMTGSESGAYELNHRGSIHRASDFNQLLSWVKEYRVSARDSYRQAGTEEWLPVMSRREFASILNPDNQWSISMASGVFRAPDFDTIVTWAKEGRITDDAIVEGPRTPPGGVSASALPALASYLREIPGKSSEAPFLRIDGREFRAPDTETVRTWIRESRVPIEAQVSLDGKNWETVSSCGLFDLEDWPSAAHGVVEEQELPEMPPQGEPPVRIVEEIEETGHSEPESEEGPESLEDSPREEPGSQRGQGEPPYKVATAETEITVESVSELKRLLKKRVKFSYDEVKHPSIREESISVGEYLETLRRSGRKRTAWIWGSLAVAVAGVCALELSGVIEIVPWF